MSRAERWTPVYHLLYEMTEGRQRNWRIIALYPEWERSGMTPRERFDEYLQYFRERLPLDMTLRSDNINAFGHRCRFLWCQCTVKAKETLKRQLRHAQSGDRIQFTSPFVILFR